MYKCRVLNNITLNSKDVGKRGMFFVKFINLLLI